MSRFPWIAALVLAIAGLCVGTAVFFGPDRPGNRAPSAPPDSGGSPVLESRGASASVPAKPTAPEESAAASDPELPPRISDLDLSEFQAPPEPDSARSLTEQRRILGKDPSDVSALDDLEALLRAEARRCLEAGDPDGSRAALREILERIRYGLSLSSSPEEFRSLDMDLSSLAQDLIDLGASQDGIVAARLLREIGEAAVGASPTSDGLRDNLTWARDMEGWLLARAGRPMAALEVYRTALAERLALPPGKTENAFGRKRIHWSHGAIGWMLARTGDLPGALDSHREAVEAIQQLLRESPKDGKYRSGLAYNLWSIGWTRLAQGDLNGAESAGRDAIELHRVLIREKPDNNLYQWCLALEENLLGDVSYERGDYAVALAHHRAAYDWAVLRTEAEPFTAHRTNDLTYDLRRMARDLLRLSRPEDARKLLDRALTLDQELVKVNPDNLDHSWHLAGSLHDRGVAFGEKESLMRARVLRAALVEQEPDCAPYAFDLAETTSALAALEAAAGETEAARRLREEARIALTELCRLDPTNAWWSRALGGL